MRYNKDHKPTGDHAKAAALPKGFQIAGAIRVTDRPTPLTKGMEAEYEATHPSVADVRRLVEAGALVVLDDERNAGPFEVEEAAAAAAPKEKTLEDGTVAELVELAKTEGHDLGSATKKADIIEAIIAGRKAKAGTPDGPDGGAPPAE